MDVKLGLRMLIKYPGLTLTAVLGMAVAIGAGVFSVLKVMFDPTLPLDEGETVIAVQNVTVASTDDHRSHLHDHEIWREEVCAIEDLGAYRLVERNLVTSDGQAEPLRIAEMTASGFRGEPRPPAAGAYLLEQDERDGAPAVVVIGYDVWQERFAGQSDIVGQTLQLGAMPYTVIGVMPEGFAFPNNHRLCTALQLDASHYARGEAPPVSVFGRLAPGATLEQAQAQLTIVGQRMAEAHPETHEHIRPRMPSYTRSYFGSAELPWESYLFQVLVSTLLVVIAVNVAILVYVRTATRTGEIAVRIALGASRGRAPAGQHHGTGDRGGGSDRMTEETKPQPSGR